MLAQVERAVASSSQRTARAVLACVACVLGALASAHATPSRAADDATTVQLYAATFNGTGVVKPPPDGSSDWAVVVDTYNRQIVDHECSAIATIGTAPAGVLRCSFSYAASFTPLAGCNGTAIGSGWFVLFLATERRAYEFLNMRAVVSDGTVHGVSTEYRDPVTGLIRNGYAQFEFAQARCGTVSKNFGRALY